MPLPQADSERIVGKSGVGATLQIHNRNDWETVVGPILESAEQCGVLGWSTRLIDLWEHLYRTDSPDFPGYESEETQGLISQFLGSTTEDDYGSLVQTFNFELESVFVADSDLSAYSGIDDIFSLFDRYLELNALKGRWISYLSNSIEELDNPSVITDGKLASHFFDRPDNHPSFELSLSDWKQVEDGDFFSRESLGVVDDFGITEHDENTFPTLIWKVRHFLDSVAKPLGMNPPVAIIFRHRYWDEIYGTTNLGFQAGGFDGETALLISETVAMADDPASEL